LDLSHDYAHADDDLTRELLSPGCLYAGRSGLSVIYRSARLPHWLYWVLLGLIAGSLAKFLVPGRDPSGCIVTVVLGIIGAFIGGLIGSALGWGRVAAGDLDLRSLGIATLGAIVVLLVGRMLRRHR
jgi:uncharacterized membrane protein YeaQ/YmgE (transglycosylase-associated protein family)